MKEKNNNQEIERLREHITKCLIDKVSNFRFSINQSIQYQITLKTWCVTLFMASVGFCLTASSNTNYRPIFNLLPFFPILLFWFYHSYRDYITELRQSDEHLKEISKLLSEFYEFSYEELIKISKDLIPKKFEPWTQMGKTKPCRGLKKIFIYTPKKMFLHFENLIFFGTIFIFWGTALLFVL